MESRESAKKISLLKKKANKKKEPPSKKNPKQTNKPTTNQKNPQTIVCVHLIPHLPTKMYSC